MLGAWFAWGGVLWLASRWSPGLPAGDSYRSTDNTQAGNTISSYSKTVETALSPTDKTTGNRRRARRQSGWNTTQQINEALRRERAPGDFMSRNSALWQEGAEKIYGNSSKDQVESGEAAVARSETRRETANCSRKGTFADHSVCVSSHDTRKIQYSSGLCTDSIPTTRAVADRDLHSDTRRNLSKEAEPHLGSDILQLHLVPSRTNGHLGQLNRASGSIHDLAGEQEPDREQIEVFQPEKLSDSTDRSDVMLGADQESDGRSRGRIAHQHSDASTQPVHPNADISPNRFRNTLGCRNPASATELCNPPAAKLKENEIRPKPRKQHTFLDVHHGERVSQPKHAPSTKSSIAQDIMTISDRSPCPQRTENAHSPPQTGTDPRSVSTSWTRSAFSDDSPTRRDGIDPPLSPKKESPILPIRSRTHHTTSHLLPCNDTANMQARSASSGGDRICAAPRPMRTDSITLASDPDASPDLHLRGKPVGEEHSVQDVGILTAKATGVRGQPQLPGPSRSDRCRVVGPRLSQEESALYQRRSINARSSRRSSIDKGESMLSPESQRQSRYSSEPGLRIRKSATSEDPSDAASCESRALSSSPRDGRKMFPDLCGKLEAADWIRGKSSPKQRAGSGTPSGHLMPPFVSWESPPIKQKRLSALALSTTPQEANEDGLPLPASHQRTLLIRRSRSPKIDASSSPVWSMLHQAIESVSGGVPTTATRNQSRKSDTRPRRLRSSRICAERRPSRRSLQNMPFEREDARPQVSDLSEDSTSPILSTHILAELDAAQQENEFLRDHLSRMAVQLDALRCQQKASLRSNRATEPVDMPGEQKSFAAIVEHPAHALPLRSGWQAKILAGTLNEPLSSSSDWHDHATAFRDIRQDELSLDYQRYHSGNPGQERPRSPAQVRGTGHPRPASMDRPASKHSVRTAACVVARVAQEAVPDHGEFPRRLRRAQAPVSVVLNPDASPVQCYQQQM
jgi:hypothetical protein